jgi:hypothetical protein
MTSELKPGFHIEEFVRGGPKNYAYIIVDPATGNRETVCKVRGITLHYSTSLLVNFDFLKDMILRGDKTEQLQCTLSERLRERGRVGDYK